MEPIENPVVVVVVVAAAGPWSPPHRGPTAVDEDLLWHWQCTGGSWIQNQALLVPLDVMVAEGLWVVAVDRAADVQVQQSVVPRLLSAAVATAYPAAVAGGQPGT